MNGTPRATGAIDRRTLLHRGGMVIGGVTGAGLLGHASAAGALGTVGRDAVAAPHVVVSTLTGTAIQAALDALPVTGGVVQLVAGTYAITRPLTLRSNCQLVGVGRAVTTLQLAAGANSTVIKNFDPVKGNAHVAVRSLTVDGNKSHQDATTDHNGVELHKCADMLLDDLECRDCAGHGILVSGDGTVTRVGRLLSIDSHNNALTGIYVSWAMREITYTSVTADVNGQDGVIIDHSEAIVTGMHCSRNARDGLHITNVIADNLTGVTADLNGRYGIHVMGFINSAGAAWCAHSNGQTQAASDVYFSGATGSYGLTDHAIVNGIECGAAQKSTWGGGYPVPPTPTETFGLTIDPVVVGNVTLIGVRNTGGKSGPYSIPPAGRSGRLVLVDHPVGTAELRVLRGSLDVVAGDIVQGSPTARVGFYGVAPAAKPTVTGSKSANAGLASLVKALATLGLITDATS